MRAYEIILKKRNGGSLNEAEINFFIKGFVKGDIPDYQAAALMMAIYFNGMNELETSQFTMAMVNSGERIDLSGVEGIVTDKHSTGGVGDKTTIVLAPWVAACGAKVAKMAGRGLGHTGGTIDKLESIPGFCTSLSPEEFINAVNKTGVAVTEQTANLVPADKKLYVLRDLTASVESVPLIASSIMSKKIAAGANAIMLDVKAGNGAFMKTREDALKLVRTMVKIGESTGHITDAVITSMDQPLGFNIGNSLEVIEAIETLKGRGPSDLKELCLVLGERMLVMSKVVEDMKKGRELMLKVLKEGIALEKFREMVKNQHGRPEVADDYSILPAAHHIREIEADTEGYVQSIDTQEIGLTAMLLGAGKESRTAEIDPAAGIALRKKYGDMVKKGETLAVIHTNREKLLKEAGERIKAAYATGREKPKNQPRLFL